MFIDAETLEQNTTVSSAIAIVGSGPAGIVLALELAQAGFEIILIESGRLNFSEAIQNLGAASDFDLKRHAPMSECTRRQLGGTSIIWGGRCLPLDRVDFDDRPFIPHSNWPIAYEEIECYFQKTCDYLFCGKSDFNIGDIPNVKQQSIVPGLLDTEILNSTLERWSLPTNFGKEYFNDLKYSRQIKLFYGLTCTEIVTNENGNQVEFLRAKTLGGKNIELKCQKYVLAGGALNTTRLLLTSDLRHPGGIGNHSEMLGKFYMGHLSGSIAVAQFSTPSQNTIFGFDQDSDNVYLRRRFSFTKEFLHKHQLSNIVAWLGVPKFGDPSHQNGILSAAYIALNTPFVRNYLTSKAIRRTAIGTLDQSFKWLHIKNVLKDFIQVITSLPVLGYQRYVANRKIPALFVYSGINEYPLQYHSEQIPNPKSTVGLSDEQDELGVRRLNINLQFTQQDVDSVIASHKYWDEYLQQHNCGRLKYVTNDTNASVWEQAGDGYHQIGTTRMSAEPNAGVVGTNCNVHGVDNLFIASSSIFVTSGQANSTFTILSFALRLADHIKKTYKNN
jgi:hypothetical protein